MFKAGSSPACSRRYAATQLPSVPSPMPSSRATAATGRDPSITSFTASSRNCGEKVLFARANCLPLQIDQFYLVNLSGKTVAAQVGPEVTTFKSGDEVFGISRGSFAEYAVAREDKLVH